MSETQQRVMAWLKSEPSFLAWAKKTATGNEFEYGYDELQESLYDMLYSNSGLSAFGFGSPAIVRARDELRKAIAKDEFDRMDWAALRTAILAE
jgi:hypothetical protein